MAEQRTPSGSHRPQLERVRDAAPLPSAPRDGRRASTAVGVRELRERFAVAFEHAPIGMALVDGHGRILTVNRSLAAIAGRSRRELCALAACEVSLAAPGGEEERLRAELLAGERDAYEHEGRCVRGDGSVAWVHLAVSAMRGADGEAWCCLAQVQDITARRSAEEHLRAYVAHLDGLGRSDPLTGLPTRAALLATLREAIAAGPGSLAVLRESGDVVAAAEAVRVACAPGEAVGLTGAGELAVVLPGTPGALGAARAEQLARVAAERSGRAPDPPGVTTWRSPRAAPRRVLARAQAAAPAPPPAGERLVSHRVQRILELAREQLGMDVAFLGELDGDTLMLRGVAGAAASFSLRPGAGVPVPGPLRRRIADGRSDRVVADVAGAAWAPDLPLVAAGSIGAYAGVPLPCDGGGLPGVVFCLDHGVRDDIGPRELGLLRSLAGLLAETLAEEAAAERRRRADSQGVGIHALLAALAARDHYTGEHTHSVVLLATAVAARLELLDAERAEVQQVATLHDIGKVGVPDAILQKQGALDPGEWELMRQHSLIGERVIAGIPGLAHLARAVRAEHERWDGAGYPDQLRGEAIPLASRIALVCDAYHAMTSDRPYRARLDEATALEELRDGAGTQFDPAVVEALLRVLQAD